MKPYVPAVLMFGFIAAAPAAEVPPTPGDFAYGMRLQTDGAGAIYQVPLPAEVYRRLTRTDLGDLRVFNAAGESVPHVLRRPRPAETKPALTGAPLFPLYTASGALDEGMVLDVRKDRAGTLMRIETREKIKGARKLAGYLLDTGKLKQPAQALEIEWKDVPKEFVGRMTLEASDDLTTWSTLASATVAHVTYGGQQLERRRLEFRPRQAKYLRLAWPAGQETPALKAVRLELSDDAPKPQVLWAALAPAGAGDNPGEYLFTLHGRVPPERVRVLFPQTNTLVQIELRARENPSAPWQRFAQGTAYRLSFGTETLASPDLQIGGAMAPRHWLLRAQPPDGLGQGAPGLEFGWTPHELVFLARGSGPFQLAYGAAQVVPVYYPLTGLLAEVERDVGDAVTNSKIRSAGLGPEAALGGEERLAVQVVVPWKKWLLWGILIAGVAVLGWMAHRLLRQMGPPPSTPGP